MPGLMLAVLGAVSLAAMQPPAERDWSAALRLDAQAIHDDLDANHPGPVNALDSGFARQNEAQLRLALRRAGTARTYADYFFALREYVAAFNDGHLNFGAYGDTPSDSHWPGFLTAYQADGSQRVVDRLDDAPVPLGARLVSCDGRPAEQLAEEIVGRFQGRWMLLSQRLRFGYWVFGDEGNPYVRRPVRCRFDVAGRTRDVMLAWRSIDLWDLLQKIQRLEGQTPRETALRTLPDGTHWITLGSFDSQSQAGRALPQVIAALRADHTALVAASAIVLDLRGNGGGSSDWSRQIAETIWGRGRIARLPGSGVQVDWRASAANLASLRESRERQIAAGTLSPEMRRWFDQATTGIAGALAQGQALWRHTGDEEEPLPQAPAPVELGPTGPVFLITDASCASACLDAVDLWRALGAVHVGQTTSADTLYMDVRMARLPSGITGMSVPMKVYRGRPRGANQPVVPVHAFAGNIGDTAELERWIASLPERRR